MNDEIFLEEHIVTCRACGGEKFRISISTKVEITAGRKFRTVFFVCAKDGTRTVGASWEAPLLETNEIKKIEGDHARD